MEQVFQALIDRSRAPLNLKTIKTILGYRHRPKYHKRKGRQWEVAVENPTYDLTIFRLHCGNLALKIYTKGERVLRIEAIAHDVAELHCGRSLEKFPEIVSALKSMLERFLNTLSCIDQCFIADETLEQLPAPVQLGKTKVGGIDFNKPRMRWGRPSRARACPCFERLYGFSVGSAGTRAEPAKRIGLRPPSCRIRSQEAPRQTAHLSDWQYRKIPAPCCRSENPGGATTSPRKSHQALAGCRSEPSTDPGPTESETTRLLLPSHLRRHARRLSRTRNSRMKRQLFFPLLPPRAQGPRSR